MAHTGHLGQQISQLTIPQYHYNSNGGNSAQGFTPYYSRSSSSTTLINQNQYSYVQGMARESRPVLLHSKAVVYPQISESKVSRIRRGDLIGKKKLILEYAHVFIEDMFHCDSGPSPQFANQVSLDAFLTNIMARTRITTSTLITAFFYLERLKLFHPKCKGSSGSGHRLFLAAIILAAKYMYDDTFDNTAWATVSSGLFDLEQVNHMEREMLNFLEFKLFIRSFEWIQFNERLNACIRKEQQSIITQTNSHYYPSPIEYNGVKKPNFMPARQVWSQNTQQSELPANQMWDMNDSRDRALAQNIL